jgi:hypothetical protein
VDFDLKKRYYDIFEGEFIMGKYDEATTFSLISRFIALIKLFFAKEKIQVQQVARDTVKTSLPALILVIGCMVFLIISGIYLLVSLVLVLNIWFMPWASSLIAAGLFLVSGLVFGLSALKIAKKGLGETRSSINRIKEELKWLKKS